MKETKMRGMVRRGMVTVPGPLRGQRVWEIQDKFYERLSERQRLRLNGRLAWKICHIATSIDFAKRDDVLDSPRARALILWCGRAPQDYRLPLRLLHRRDHAPQARGGTFVYEPAPSVPGRYPPQVRPRQFQTAAEPAGTRLLCRGQHDWPVGARS